MAEGRSNAAVAHRIWVNDGTVEKHVGRILAKLNRPETGDDHRPVLAAITFLEALWPPAVVGSGGALM
jgi:DNA-binding NarL/FixJ family response regulator